MTGKKTSLRAFSAVGMRCFTKIRRKRAYMLTSFLPRCRGGTPVLYPIKTSSQLLEDSIGFFQTFLLANVKPDSGDAPSVNGRARIEPLNQPARLVGVVAFGDVFLNQRKRRLGVKIKRDASDGAGRVLGLFF